MLEWNNPNRHDFEKMFNKKRIDIPFMMPHEFLFLLCNCMNRIDSIKKFHDPVQKQLASDLYYVHM